MDVHIERKLPVYRCVLKGELPEKQYSTLAEALMPLLLDGYPHLLLDARGAQGLTPGAVSLLLAPLIRILLKGGGVAVVGAPEALQRSLDQLGLLTRIPTTADIESGLEAILRMIPKRYSNSFFTLLLAEGVATAPQIQELHDEYKQRQGAVPFGTLLIQRGILTIERLLQLLDRTENPDRYRPAPSPAPVAAAASRPPRPDLPRYTRGDLSVFASPSEFHQPRLLGEILIESGLITEEQLRDTIAEQRGRGELKLGDLLVQRGLLNPNQLFEALELQISRKGQVEGSGLGGEARSEFVQKSLLGEIFLEMGLIREQDLRLALDEQRSRPGTKIGNILLQMGVVDSDALLQALEYQANRRG